MSDERAVSTKNKATDLDYSQWQVGPNGKFRPATQTIPHLAPGVYKPGRDDGGMFLQQQNVISDSIVELPETANVRVLQGMKKFWNSQSKYEEFGFVYKRGILLWGPPGSGKTVTINILMKELISLEGIVLLCSDPEMMEIMLQRIRVMEPDRAIIVVMEDIDEIIERHQEHSILSMLDGENQISNVVYIATTNHPERLGARMVNRPSRFDERIFVGMPSEIARRHYLRFAAPKMEVDTLETWVKDTKNFSIAHLRELVAASYCLDQEYPDVLKRLKSMTEKPKFVDGFRRGNTGFGISADDGDDEDSSEAAA
jgi:ATPase family associated with various cellular activities (AAA)